jgi:hypothetical protein
MVGIDLTTLSVFGGALGVGLGLGLQKIASNYVSGFIILLDNSIRLGNVISVGNDRGEVTRITTRYTVLKDVTGVESLVPNELLVGSVVRNESYSNPRVRLTLPVQIATRAISNARWKSWSPPRAPTRACSSSRVRPPCWPALATPASTSIWRSGWPIRSTASGPCAPISI